MSTIQSVMQETRVFEPSPAWAEQANITAGRLRGDARQGRARFRGLLGRPRARDAGLAQAVHEGARRERRRRSTSGSTTASSTPRTTASTATSRTATRDKVAIIFEADDGKVTQVTYRELHQRVCRFANGARSRSASRRATASSSTCRCRSKALSRCRPARASAPRIRWCSAASPRSRCRSASSTPARSRSSPPTSRCAAASALPLKAIVDEALGMGGCEAVQQRRRLPAHRRQRSTMAAGRDLWLHELIDSASRHLRAGMGRAPSIRCSSSTPPARPASPRACSTPPAATCCGRRSR